MNLCFSEWLICNYHLYFIRPMGLPNLLRWWQRQCMDPLPTCVPKSNSMATRATIVQFTWQGLGLGAVAAKKIQKSPINVDRWGVFSVHLSCAHLVYLMVGPIQSHSIWVTPHHQTVQVACTTREPDRNMQSSVDGDIYTCIYICPAWSWILKTMSQNSFMYLSPIFSIIIWLGPCDPPNQWSDHPK